MGTEPCAGCSKDSQELLIQEEDRIFYRRACDRGDNRKYRLSATAARPEPVQVPGPAMGPGRRQSIGNYSDLM